MIRRNHVNRYYEREILDSHPEFRAGTGALSIQHGASATFNHMSVAHNELAGILVFRGSTAEITDLTLSDTYCLEPSIRPPDPFRIHGGFDVHVRLDSHVEITDFLITQNCTVGLAIQTGGEMDLHEPKRAISPNTILASVGPDATP